MTLFILSLTNTARVGWAQWPPQQQQPSTPGGWQQPWQQPPTSSAAFRPPPAPLAAASQPLPYPASPSLHQQQHYHPTQQQQQPKHPAHFAVNSHQTPSAQPIRTVPQPQDLLTATFERVGRLHQATLFHRADVGLDLEAAHTACIKGLHEVEYHRSKLWGILERNKLHANILQPLGYNATVGDFKHNSDADYLYDHPVPQKKFGPRLVASYLAVADLYDAYKQDCKDVAAWLPGHSKRGAASAILTFMAGTAFNAAVSFILAQTTASMAVKEPLQDFATALKSNNLALLYHDQTLSWTNFQATLDHQVSRMTASRNANKARLMQFEAALSDLQRGHLSVGLVGQPTLQRVYANAARTAMATDTKVPFASPASILELPAAYSTNSTAITVHILIPLVGGTFTLFKAEPTPIVLADDTHHPLLYLIDATPNLIAVSKKANSIIVPTAEDMEACLTVGTDRICTAPVQSKQAYNCLPCLYFGNKECAAQTCQVLPSNKPWIVRPAPNQQYSITVLEQTDLKTHCHSAAQSTTSLTLSPGTNVVKVPAGCTASSKLFSIRAPYFLISTPIVSTAIQWDVRNSVFQDLTNEAITSNSEVIRQAAFHTRKAVNSIHEATATKTSIIASIASAIVSIGLLALAGYAAFRCFFQRSIRAYIGKLAGEPAATFTVKPEEPKLQGAARLIEEA